ncbi:hypothetical protein D3C80_1745960 [compost metagenome]
MRLLPGGQEVAGCSDGHGGRQGIDLTNHDVSSAGEFKGVDPIFARDVLATTCDLFGQNRAAQQ